MFLGAEFVAFGAGAAAMSYAYSDNAQQEEDVRKQLCTRYFGADLPEQAGGGEATALTAAVPPGLHAQAKRSIEIIDKYLEKYTKTGGLTLRSLFSRGDSSKVVRARVLAQLKQWLLTLSEEGSTDIQAVTKYLDFCTQFLLRPSVFKSPGSQDFLPTMAQVCGQLEDLFRQETASQHTGHQQLSQLLEHTRALADALLPVLLLTLPGEAAVPRRSRGSMAEPRGWLNLSALIDDLAADGSAAGAGEGASDGPLLNLGTDVGRVLACLLGAQYFRWLGTGEGQGEGAGVPPAGAASQTGTPDALPHLVEDLRTRWQESPPGATSGLLTLFHGPGRQRAGRLAYLDLCQNLDRVAYFCDKLRAFHGFAGMTGDITMCAMRDHLGFLLQEIERALLQLSQSRQEVMRAARLQLQEFSAGAVPRMNTEEFRWMQGLRHVDEAHLDSLHGAVNKLCMDVRRATTAAREVELKGEARRKLTDMGVAFESAEFRARCSAALPAFTTDPQLALMG